MKPFRDDVIFDIEALRMAPLLKQDRYFLGESTFLGEISDISRQMVL